ncbi:MAG: hypothetical protein QOD00_1235, partial [Blastocatellia bacterium]|nr:hypothetical protein [Blastocatellia bacterium]
MDKNLPESQLLQSLIDASLDGILAFDRACRYTAWNAAMERISGLRSEEVVGRTAFDIFPFLKQTGEDKYFYEALAGRSAVAESRPYTIPETGHRGFFDGYYSPLRDASGEVIGGVAIIRDITARYETEEALRESEERYRAFIANSSEGIWRFELERAVRIDLPEDDQIELFYQHGYLAECNDAMARMYGYDRAVEITGARLSDLLVRDDPNNIEYLHGFISSSYRLTDAESVEVDREGRQRFFSNNLVGVVENGLVLRAWGTQRDVTERKRIEEELRATEHRFFMFMENLPGLAWIKDIEGRYVYVNEAAARAFRMAREELLGKLDDEIFPAETAAKFRENDMLALSGGAGVLTVETLEQDDGVHHSIVSKFPIPGHDGAALMVGGIAIDMTERMRAEAALRESEEKYRGLLENANDIIYSHDLQGNYLTINRACEVITGYTREEILGGLNIAQVVVPEHLELAKRMTELKLRDPSPTVYEIDILTKDGRRLTIEVSTRVSQREGQGAIIEGIARDVTDRKRGELEREELLRREQQARRDAEEALAVARSIEDSLGVLVEASGVLLGSLNLEDVQPAILDLSRRLISADAYAIWRGDYQAKVWRIVSSAGLSEEYRGQRIEGWEPRNFVFDEPVIAENIEQIELLETRRAQYKSEGICSLLAVPMRIHGDASGTLTYYYRQPHRFSDRELRVATALANLASAAIASAELYDEQRRLRAEAERANRLKDEFLATVSHELRTPLTAILGWATMLRSDRSDEHALQRAIETIERNAKNQKQIIEDLLDVSRIITGKLRLEIRPVELASLIEAAVESLRPAADAKGVRFQKQLDTGLNHVSGDPARLQQIVWNLLSNAIKFTPGGGRVQIRLERIASHV